MKLALFEYVKNIKNLCRFLFVDILQLLNFDLVLPILYCFDLILFCFVSSYLILSYSIVLPQSTLLIFPSLDVIGLNFIFRFTAAL